MATVSGIQGAFSDFGSAVSDLFASKGAKISAAGYRRAAGITRENIKLVEYSNEIKQLMADREIYKTIGGQQADVAGAGFAASGTALDLLRDSQAQGELTKHLLETQGDIDVNELQARVDLYETQAAAAKNAAKGSLISAGIKAVAGIGKLFF